RCAPGYTGKWSGMRFCTGPRTPRKVAARPGSVQESKNTNVHDIGTHFQSLLARLARSRQPVWTNSLCGIVFRKTLKLRIARFVRTRCPLGSKFTWRLHTILTLQNTSTPPREGMKPHRSAVNADTPSGHG